MWRSKAARYFAYCAAGAIAAVVAAAFILPAFLDLSGVEAQIQRKLSEAVHGEVAWDALRVRLLPSPRGSLRGVRLEVPGVASVRAEEADAHLSLLPLFRGRAEITSVSIVRPAIRIDLALAEGASPAGKAPPMDPVAAYRSALGPVIEAIRRIAPGSLLSVEDADVEIRAPGAPPIRLSKLSLRAQTGPDGMDFEMTAASNYWSRLRFTATIAFADLSGSASLDAADIRPQAWLDRYLAEPPVSVAVPAANLRAQARTDGKTSLECDFDLRAGPVEILRAAQRLQVPGIEAKGNAAAGAEEIGIRLDEVRLGASALAGARLRYSPKRGAASGNLEFDLDLAQGMDAARRLVPDEAGAALAAIESVTGRAQGRVKLDFGRSGWNVRAEVLKSDSSVQIRKLPGPASLASVAVDVTRDTVKVDRAVLSMLDTSAIASATISNSPAGPQITGNLEFDLDLAQGMEAARRLVPDEEGAALAAIESVTGRAQGRVKLDFGPSGWNVRAEVLKSDSSVQVSKLPGPVSLAGVSVDISGDTVKVERAALSMLDASAIASATIISSPAGPQITGSVAEGRVGGKFMEWVRQIAQLPPNLQLRTPIQFAAQRIALSPKQALEVEATARFDAGPDIAVELGWAQDALDLRRLAIKDERSDAAIALRSKGRALEGKFSGSLYSTSIAAMLKNADLPFGSVTGNLHVNFDRDSPGRGTAEGDLKGEALDLAPLLGRPVKIDRIDLAADNTILRVREASVNWAGQHATLRGEIRRGAGGPVIDAQLDSPGVILDAIFPPEDKAAGEKPEEGRQPPAGKGEPSPLWPLPVTGRVAVRSDFLQYGRHKLAPVTATLALEERRALLDLKEAQLCGISLPLTIEATPQGVSASARFTAQKQSLEQTARCLSDEQLQITGDFDLKADVRSKGKLDELARNLEGSVGAEVRDGRVMKFALLGKILSMENISALLKGGPRLDQAGFPYRNITVNGRFQAGRFLVDEAAFRSDAVGLAATGWISILDYHSRLSVLVAPLGRLDALVRKVPILGYVLGGALTSVPVGVSGDIRDPAVVPLGPAAITSELTGIFERTLKVPSKLLAPLKAGPASGSPPDAQ